MTDEETFSIEIPADDEGYFRLQCPHCDDEFKLRADEFEAEEPSELTCALCGMQGNASVFIAREDVQEVLRAEAVNRFREHLDDMFKDLERETRSSDFIQFERKGQMKKEDVPELREFSDLAVVDLPCCDRHAKVDPSAASSVVYCSYCSQILA